MKKVFISTLLITFSVSVGWYYAPQNVRERLTAFIGLAARRDTGEIKNFIEDVVLPADPEKRRGVLISELKKDLGEIKRRASPAQKAELKIVPAPSKVGSATTPELLGAAEKALEELEKSNGDGSVAEKVIERILERILPSPPANGECRPTETK